MLNKRTQILFDEELWLYLSALSKTENISVGELVRRAVKETYRDTPRMVRRKEAVEAISSLRKKFKKIDYKALINYGRKY